MTYVYRCELCGQEFPGDEIHYRCSSCNGPLLITYDYQHLKGRVTATKLAGTGPGLWRYKALLPMQPNTEVITLGEGGTPLLTPRKLARLLGLSQLLIKYEGSNPTGSFKDRGTAVGMAVAVERGFDAVGTVSHGNMGTSVAAYAARAGRTCYIIAPANIASVRLLFLSVYGAKVLQVTGRYDSMYDESIRIAQKTNVFFINCDNPFRIEGHKTLAFEIAEGLDWDVPDWIVAPASSGGMVSALYKGFLELHTLGIVSGIPKIAVVQPEDAQPIVEAFEKGTAVKPMKHESDSIVRSLGNPYPPSGDLVVKRLRDFDGTAIAVPDEETIAAQRELARLEGICAEPAGAITLAGLRRLLELGRVKKSDKVVLIVSGFGFRDPGEPQRLVDEPITVDIEELASVVSTYLLGRHRS